MPKHTPNKPTDAELTLLHVLWQRGPATVREVHDVLPEAGAYTTTLKTLQIMFQKGLVTRDDTERSHIYAAAVARDDVQTSLLDDLAQKAFGGSAARLALRALALERASDDELDELQALIAARRGGTDEAGSSAKARSAKSGRGKRGKKS